MLAQGEEGSSHPLVLTFYTSFIHKPDSPYIQGNEQAVPPAIPAAGCRRAPPWLQGAESSRSGGSIAGNSSHRLVWPGVLYGARDAPGRVRRARAAPAGDDSGPGHAPEERR